MVVVSCYVDTLLGEQPSLTPGTEPLPGNNQTLATGFSGGDTGQLVSLLYLYFFTVLYPHISTPALLLPPQHRGPDGHLLPPQLAGRHPGRGGGRVRAEREIHFSRS